MIAQHELVFIPFMANYYLIVIELLSHAINFVFMRLHPRDNR